MEQHNYNKQHTLNDIISEYEAMSQKGTVVFYEEAVYIDIVKYYQKEKNYDLALIAVETALSQHNFSARLYCEKAKLIFYHDATFIEDALHELDKAEKLSPGDFKIRLLKAELLGNAGKHDDAFSLLTSVRKDVSYPNPKQLADIYYREGLLHENLREYDDMFKVWRQALLLDTRHAGILQKMWLCVEWGHKQEESIALFEEIIDEDPYCHLAWFYLGNALVYFGRYKDAIDAYEYAFICDNTFEWAYKECAAICMITKNYTKALECYKEALDFIHPDGDLLFEIGRCYQLLGNIDAALELYKRASDIDDYNDELFYSIGQCLLDQGNFKDAIDLFNQAVELDDKREEYFVGLGKAYFKLDRYEEAYTNFGIATELAPEQATVWFQFAIFLFELDAVDQALCVLDDADLHAVGEELLYCRVACLENIGRNKEAIAILADILEESTEQHELLFDYIPDLVYKKDYMSVIDYYVNV